MKRFLTCYGYLVLVTMVTCAAGTKQTCAELEFTGFRHGQTVKVSENSYVSVTCHLNTLKCRNFPEWFRLQVTYHQGIHNIAVCNIILSVSPAKCDVTDQSAYCRCVSEAGLSALLYKQLNHAGNISYLWSWSDSFSGQTQKKAQIMFDVTSQSGGGSVPTSQETNDEKGEAMNLQVVFINSTVTAFVIGIFIAICIYVYIRKRASVSRPAADDDRRQEAEISTDERRLVQETRPRPRVEEAEYMDLDDADPCGICSAKVHENYKLPAQAEGEVQFGYSRLQMNFLRCWIRGQESDAERQQEQFSSNAEMVKVSPIIDKSPSKDLPDD